MTDRLLTTQIADRPEAGRTGAEDRLRADHEPRDARLAVSGDRPVARVARSGPAIPLGPRPRRRGPAAGDANRPRIHPQRDDAA